MSYSVIKLTQGTSEWLAWRMDGISSTDISIIMGLNPYETVRDLWLHKTGQEDKTKDINEAMQHGIDHEESIRNIFTKTTSIEVEPACVTNNQYPFIRSSLDGLSIEKNVVAEFKAPKFFHSYKKAKEDLQPYYFAQIQWHLLAAAGTTSCFFCSWFESTGLYLKEYFPDLIFQKESFRRAVLFKKLIDNRLDFDDNIFSTFDLSYLLNPSLI